MDQENGGSVSSRNYFGKLAYVLCTTVYIAGSFISSRIIRIKLSIDKSVILESQTIYINELTIICLALLNF